MSLIVVMRFLSSSEEILSITHDAEVSVFFAIWEMLKKVVVVGNEEVDDFRFTLRGKDL